MQSFYVYILRCRDGSYYTGHTDDIDARIGTHKLGAIKSCYTYKRRPVEVVYVSEFGTRDEAFTAERQIKGWCRRKKEALINGEFYLLQYLAKNNHAKYQAAKCEKIDKNFLKRKYYPSTSSG